MENLTIAIGSDHGGFEYKNLITEHLKQSGITTIDAGTYTKGSCDYPDIARKVTALITEGKAMKGILICGSGIGMSIAANKTKGIRAALCSETTSAKLSRQHNDSNVLCMGQRLIGETMALEIVDVWLQTKFSGGRHQHRVDIIEQKG